MYVLFLLDSGTCLRGPVPRVCYKTTNIKTQKSPMGSGGYPLLPSLQYTFNQLRSDKALERRVIDELANLDLVMLVAFFDIQPRAFSAHRYSCDFKISNRK